MILPFPLFAVTLDEAFRAAIKHESVQIERSRFEQVESQIDQARSSIFPEINARGSYLIQQDSPVFSSPVIDKNRKSLSLELIQPLFQGFQEFAAIRLAQGEKLAQMARLERSKVELFSNLYQVFFSIKKIEKEIDHIEELYQLSTERVNFIDQRVRIGRSRQSELISAKAQMMTVSSQLEGAKSRLIDQRERFYTLTGLSSESEITLENFKDELGPLEFYLNKSQSSAWVKPEKFLFDASEERVQIARADYYPSFDLRANYYPYREGSLEDVRWDVTFNMTIPLYSGGLRSARVRQAVHEKKESELRYRLQKKDARENVRTAYLRLENGRSQLDHFRQAVRLNRENYELQRREYGLGLVSNLDVLQALNQYIQSRRDLSDLELENSQYYYQLMALTGDIFENN